MRAVVDAYGQTEQRQPRMTASLIDIRLQRLLLDTRAKWPVY